ncbi:MAG: 5-formyltetrahydrofolate cyclo-ligase [Emcibacteraceae bacterium]|nr:5-formyltetrahydrofolate cyclo-ligase [Emcibacteraceae bacterium]
MLDKKTQRAKSLKLRDDIFKSGNGMAARKIAAQVIMLPELDEVKLISGYFPIKSELDCRVILRSLHAARFPLCLPKIINDNEPLEFRAWDMRTELEDGPFGTKEPNGEIVMPEILLIPLAAFDENGARLGYGGGYYDRTLKKLRKENPDVIAIGIAYDEQKLDRVQVESYDQPLDLVVTEKTTYRFE